MNRRRHGAAHSCAVALCPAGEREGLRVLIRSLPPAVLPLPGVLLSLFHVLKHCCLKEVLG